jgi:hypothetical protein
MRTVRSEDLNCLLMMNARHAEQTVNAFVAHSNNCRLRRSLGLVAAPNRPPSANAEPKGHPIKVRRRDRRGALVHEYERGA